MPLIAGLLLGGFYAAVTVGVSISFGILDIVNIAHPAFIILGAYIAYIVNHDARARSDPDQRLLCCRRSMLLGAVVYQVYYQSFEKHGQDALRGLAFFFGLLFVTEVLLILVFGVDYRYVQASYIDQTLHFGFDRLPVSHAGALRDLAADARRCCSSTCRAPSRAAPSWRCRRTSLALRLMAADPTRSSASPLAISIATASLAGALLIVIQPVEPSVGREYIGRVFAICVLGGLQSLPGTVIAAMLLGIVESFTATFYGPSWAPAVAFGFLPPHAGVPAGGSSRAIGGRRADLLLLSRQRSWSARRCSPARAGTATTTCSSPATRCCNSSCWRPPGTSSAAIAAM